MCTINNKIPICDTDIWIKNCKCKKLFLHDLIFTLYPYIYMSDAVRQELSRSDRDDFKAEFTLGDLNAKNCCRNGTVKVVRYKSNFFTQEQILAVEREFIDKGIIYDEHSKKFIGCKSGLGEQVTLIYAAMLEIPIILSDDNHCIEGADLIRVQYPYLNVINLKGLISKSNSLEKSVKDKIIREVNKPILQDETNKVLNNPFKKFGKKKVV